MSAVTWRLRAIPLTPIHIGDGSVLAPEEFLLNGQELLRFNPRRVLADMGAGERRRFQSELDGGRLKEAQAVLRRAADPERHVVERIALGPASLQALRQALDDPGRRGEVRPLIRTAGRPYIPGTSIKGALRTALLDALIHERDIGRVRHQLTAVSDKRRRTDRLQELAFDFDQRNTEQDPFRFIKVADAALPQGATRIDRVINWRPPRPGRPERQPAQGMQMHFERLLSSVDGTKNRPDFQVEISIDEAMLAEARTREPRKAPKVPLTAAGLWNAANDFSWRRWQEEIEHFFANEPGTRKLLERTITFKVGGQPRQASELRQNLLLLRLGRFTQFESKSVDDLREGWNPQARKPMTHGSTRNVIFMPIKPNEPDKPLKNNETEMPVPFGWLLLVKGN